MARTPRSPRATRRRLSATEFNGTRIRRARLTATTIAIARPARVVAISHTHSGPVGSQLAWQKSRDQYVMAR